MRLSSMHGSKDDCIEEVFQRSRGPGGQNVNKVSTSVTLRHLPTGISVTVQDSRSQARNRALARERLAEKIRDAAEKERLAALAGVARERRRMAKRSKGTKRKMTEQKRLRGKLKSLRGRVTD